MAFRPSQQIKLEQEELNLNLNPMMDMFAVLIPALLMLSAVVDVSVIDIAAPALDAAASPPRAPVELSLTVAVQESGYRVSAAQPLPGGDAAGAREIVIPTIERLVDCSRFRGLRPPPRARNVGRPLCGDTAQAPAQQFWVYDTAALTEKMTAIKEAYPSERRLIVTASPDVDYESVVQVLDATREVRQPNGQKRVLFDEVVVRPSDY
jgi:biopolymer transport protein ExbD